ncbi:MAG TPA: hypothetical protein VME66_08030 [Candidatus Acidoferrales bacterium]|nr:hypothetical protein [Candidatus Acidoferrales bacterium]
MEFIAVAGSATAALLPATPASAAAYIGNPSAPRAHALVAELLAVLGPQIALGKALNAKLDSSGHEWTPESDDLIERRHHIVRDIYAALQPVLEALVDANLLSATFYEDGPDECFAFFEVEKVDFNSTIDFAGRLIYEVTDPAPSLLPV